jgi:hypothetical protein
MANDLRVATKWRSLFEGCTVTQESLAAAEALLEDLSPESPLRVRYAIELRDIRKLHALRLQPVSASTRRRR